MCFSSNWCHNDPEVPDITINLDPVYKLNQNNWLFSFFPGHDYSNSHRYLEEVLRQSLSHVLNKGLQVSHSWRTDFSLSNGIWAPENWLSFQKLNKWFWFFIEVSSQPPDYLSDSFDCIHRAYLCWLPVVYCVLLAISLALFRSGLPGYYSDWPLMIIVTTLLLIVKCHHLASIILPLSLLFSGFPTLCQHLPLSAIAYREQSLLSISFMLVPLSSVHPLSLW